MVCVIRKGSGATRQGEADVRLCEKRSATRRTVQTHNSCFRSGLAQLKRGTLKPYLFIRRRLIFESSVRALEVLVSLLPRMSLRFVRGMAFTGNIDSGILLSLSFRGGFWLTESLTLV